MMRQSLLRLGALAALLLGAAACDPCAGTPTCHTQPEINYSGQLMEYPAGHGVADVRVTFVRRAGVGLLSDTLRAVSSAGGFFALRGQAFASGTVVGDLTVSPPGRPEYTVPDVELSTNIGRGNGGHLGRLTVQPYLQYIAEFRNLTTGAPIAVAPVVIRPIGPADVGPPETHTSTADNGRIFWEPTVTSFGDVVVDLELQVGNGARRYHLQDTITLQYRDEPPRLVPLFVNVGGPWAYVAAAIRRGSKEAQPGVIVEFRRTGGVDTRPRRFTDTTDAAGQFDFPLVPRGNAVLLGRLTIRPPAPLHPEQRDLEIAPFDGPGARPLGPFYYGPATTVRPVFVYRATGQPVRVGTHVRYTRTGGLPITPAPWAQPDSGVRIVDSAGIAAYDAATPDSGFVEYEAEVRLNAPHEWETIPLTAPAVARDEDWSPIVRVGAWYPWTGAVRDSVSGAPIAGATIVARHRRGARFASSIFTVTSAADGTFPLQPVPEETGYATVSLEVSAPGYRTTIRSARISTTQDDTLQSIGPILLPPLTP